MCFSVSVYYSSSSSMEWKAHTAMKHSLPCPPLSTRARPTNTLTRASPKTYQVWHHDGFSSQLCGTPCQNWHSTKSLGSDAKIITLGHRQWLLASLDQADLWRASCQSSSELLADDVRKQLAWHHRFFRLREFKDAWTFSQLLRYYENSRWHPCLHVQGSVAMEQRSISPVNQISTQGEDG